MDALNNRYLLEAFDTLNIKKIFGLIILESIEIDEICRRKVNNNNNNNNKFFFFFLKKKGRKGITMRHDYK